MYQFDEAVPVCWVLIIFPCCFLKGFLEFSSSNYKGSEAFPFLNHLNASEISLMSSKSPDISKGATSIWRVSDDTSFVYKLIQSSVTFWRSSSHVVGGWSEANEYQLWTIAYASLGLLKLRSASASALSLVHCCFQLLVKVSFQWQPR